MQKINTQLPSRTHSDHTDDEPQSVIHAPPGFRNFEASTMDQAPSVSNDNNKMVSPTTPEAIPKPEASQTMLTSGIGGLIPEQKPSPVSPVNTDLPLYMDRTTPRAQTRNEVDDDWKRRNRRESSLEGLSSGHVICPSKI